MPPLRTPERSEDERYSYCGPDHRTGSFGIEQTELEQSYADWTSLHKMIHSQPPTIELVVQKPRLHA